MPLKTRLWMNLFKNVVLYLGFRYLKVASTGTSHLEAHTGFFRFSMMGNGNFLEKVDFLIHMLVLATLLYCFFLVHLEVIPIDL